MGMRMRMDGFVVQRYGGNDGRDRNHHLSLLSPQDLTVCENFKLPFDMNDAVAGGSCGGFLYFQDDEGTIVVCNLTTKELKFFPLPDFVQPPHSGYLDATGLGYDCESKDYKLIRNYVQLFNGEADENGICSDLGSEVHFEVYSFKSESWKKISDPHASITSTTGVYVEKTGRCYWTAALGLKYFGGGLSDSNAMKIHVLSFNFATESFDHFPLPDTAAHDHARCKLCERHGSLGALVYSRMSECVELFVWSGMSWDFLYRALIPGMDRPLLLRDGRFLFVEARRRLRRRRSRRTDGDGDGELNYLMVYDFDEKDVFELRIYDFPGRMSVFSYVESRDALSNPDPMIIHDSKQIGDVEETPTATG